MRRLFTLAAAAALSGGLAACGPKPGAAVQAPSPTQTAVAEVLVPQEGLVVRGVPERVDERIDRALAARRLVPVDVPPAAFAEEFAARRTTQHRLAWLQAHNQGAPLLLLVETEAEFYSQLEGRLRWTVAVKATIAPAGDLEQAVSSEFQVPVFLQFLHEKEDAALAEAAPIIERQVGHLLDAYLGGVRE